MNTNGNTAFWAAAISSTVWAASSNQNGGVFSVVWLAFAVVIYFTARPGRNDAALSTVEARYRDLLNRLGVQGHDGAIAEIEAMRKRCGLDA